MNTMRKDITSSVLGMLVLTILCGVLFPLVVTGVGQLAFPGNANGQKVYAGGRLVGSKIIGQSFGDEPRYFQTRPSPTDPADNDAGTEFANLGPNDKVTERTLAANAAAYLSLNRPYDPSLTLAQVPVDAVDTSASGVDPDISVANADIQAHRVAAVRRLPRAEVDRLVRRFTGGRGLGFSGEPSVNVLELNLALDRAHAQGH